MPDNSNKGRKLIGSVQRALNILDLFTNQHPELGTTEIANALGLPKSTAAGLIATLEANGYLVQNPDNRKYALGFKLLERGRLLLDQLDLRQVALPHLEGLRDWCNEAVNMGILDGGYVVYIERMMGTNRLGIRSEVGKRELAHSTALGKAILALSTQGEAETYLAEYELKPVTPNTITAPDQFLLDLERTQERGFAVDDEENEVGGRCVAAPVFDHRGRVLAAVSISVPVPRFPASDVPRMGAKVREVALAISRQLGYLA